jgi:hypothetical protein
LQLQLSKNIMIKLSRILTRRKINKFLLGLVISTLCIMGLTISHSFAQEQIRTFTIVPPTLQQNLKPGDKAEGTLKVINDSTNPLTFTATLQDFVVNDNIGTPQLLPPNTLSNKYSAATWIGVDIPDFTIKPHDKQLLTYFMQIPQDARSGGHYAAVVYKPSSPIAVNGTGTAVSTIVGTLFYIDVAGNIKESAQVTKFSANGFSENGPVNIDTQIRNLGDLHIQPRGTITLTNMIGQKVGQQSLPSHNIFPQVARDYSNTFGSHWMFGRYKAELNTNYGRLYNLSLMSTLYFWVIPWKVILIIILVLVALILGYKMLKKGEDKNVKDTTPPTSGTNSEEQSPPQVTS